MLFSRIVLTVYKFNVLIFVIDEERNVTGNPCDPSPCGPNAQCQNVNKNPSCSCLPSYIGTPPSCRPECLINPDCPTNKACVNTKCKDPCPGSCGENAECIVINHAVTCSCMTGYTGNPFVQCILRKGKIHYSYRMK